MVLDILENEGISEKGCIEIENWDFSVHFGFKKFQFTVYTLHFQFDQLQTSSGKSKELKFDGILSKKMHSFS